MHTCLHYLCTDCRDLLHFSFPELHLLVVLCLLVWAAFWPAVSGTGFHRCQGAHLLLQGLIPGSSRVSGDGQRQSHPQVPCLVCQGWAELQCMPTCSEFNYCRRNEPSGCCPTMAVGPINGWCIVSAVPCVASCLWGLWQLRCCSRAWLWDPSSPQTSPDQRYWSGLGASASHMYERLMGSG